MILKLPQWAGYRDRATFGLADTYLRLGDLDKAQKYLGDLKANYTKSFESQKGPDLEKLIALRVERLKTAKTSPEVLFREFRTDFEPEEKEWFGEPKDFSIVRGPGMFGPYAGLFDSLPRELATFAYERPVKNLNPGGHYVAEIWYRDLIKPPSPPPFQVPTFNIYLMGGKPVVTLVNTSVSIYRNTNHQWHKVNVKFVAPLGK